MMLKPFQLVLFAFFGICCVPQEKEGLLNPEDFTITWDQNTLEKVSMDGFQYAGYARARELKNGNMAFAFEGDGNIYFRTKSGQEWNDPILVAGRKPGVNMAVPDFVVLENGDILLGYNPRPSGGQEGHHFAIRTIRSGDQGKTWEEDQLVYQAGVDFENGCWEPAFLTLPNGEIQLYFADEGIYTDSNDQRIAMVHSKDKGQTWTKDPQTISYRPGARDGMPVPIWLEENQQIAVAIEDNGLGSFKPFTLHNSGQKWASSIGPNDDRRYEALPSQIPASHYGGAPYLAHASNGLTLLSFQWGEQLKDAQMAVAIGNVKAEGFTNITWPFDLPEKSIGHWNSLSVLKGGSILALTSTNGYNQEGKTEVWVIKGELVKR